jgi:hypothetical protein
MDDLARPDHRSLGAEDECYCLGEYTARRGYAFSETNNLIQNLKKPMERRGLPEWRHKEEAIRTAGRMLRAVIHPQWLSVATLVPIPPSIKKGTWRHDDRVLRIIQEAAQGIAADIRELVVMTGDIEPSHRSETRASIGELRHMAIDESLVSPKPRRIGVIDDVLTTGRHFKAVEAILREQFGEIPIEGIFLARRVPEAEDDFSS